jgi:hypothetical protein
MAEDYQQTALSERVIEVCVSQLGWRGVRERFRDIGIAID